MFQTVWVWDNRIILNWLMQSYSGPVHEWTYVDIELMIIIISKTLRDAMEREYPQKLLAQMPHWPAVCLRQPVRKLALHKP